MLILAIPACLLLIWLCTVMGAASVSAGEVNRILLHEMRSSTRIVCFFPSALPGTSP